MTKTFAYYPGCSLESTAKEFELSVQAVCRELGIELKEIPDWSCCGASSGHSVNYQLSLALPGRNLAIAEQTGMELAVSCPACFLRFRRTDYDLKHDPGLKEKIQEVIGMPYEGKYETRHIMEIIYREVGIEELRKRVKKPLTGLKLVSYYGCLLVRPPKVTGFGEHENPVMMDEVMEALGAESRDWAGKIDCCGGSLALTRTDIVLKLIGDLMEEARKAGADAVICACPLCQANLDMRQSSRETLPILYFSEMIGLSMGLDAMPWFKKHMVSPVPLFMRKGLV
jgi:heterodisulfide reductase subunit B